MAKFRLIKKRKVLSYLDLALMKFWEQILHNNKLKKSQSVHYFKETATALYIHAYFRLMQKL